MKNKNLVLILCFSLFAVGCYKEDPAAVEFNIKTVNMTKKWKIDKAISSSSLTTVQNGVDVTYDWARLTFEFYNYGAYKIVDYSPDFLYSSIESGTWSINMENEM